MLIKASVWVKSQFEEGSRPTMKTVRRWVQEGVIEGAATPSATYVQQGAKLPDRDIKPKGRIDDEPEAQLSQGLQDLLHKHRP